MPRNATIEQRIQWYPEHAKHCSCRDIPEKLKAEIKRRNMKGFDNSTYLTLYIISNAVAVIMLLAAWKAPKIARVMFCFLFAWASYTNYTYASHNPNDYLNYADLSLLKIYEQFILG